MEKVGWWCVWCFSPTFSSLVWDPLGSTSRKPEDANFQTTNICYFSLLLPDRFPRGSDSSSPLWIQKGGIDVFKIVSNVWYFFQLLLIVKHSKAEIRFLEEFGISMHAQKENTFCAAFALFDVNDFWFDLTVYHNIVLMSIFFTTTLLCVFCNS